MVIQQELVISVNGRSYFGVLGQRDMIRLLLEKYGEDEETVVNAYAAAERAGRVLRESNRRGTPPEIYARGFVPRRAPRRLDSRLSPRGVPGVASRILTIGCWCSWHVIVCPALHGDERGAHLHCVIVLADRQGRMGMLCVLQEVNGTRGRTAFSRCKSFRSRQLRSSGGASVAAARVPSRHCTPPCGGTAAVMTRAAISSS